MQSFLIYSKGINDKIAFKMMKSFPVDKILAVLSQKYNISIDSSDYADFISSDTPEFEDEGLLGTSMFKNRLPMEGF